MAGILMRPRISPFLAERISILLELSDEDIEDIREGLKALSEEEGTLSWVEYQRQRAERESRGELSN